MATVTPRSSAQLLVVVGKYKLPSLISAILPVSSMCDAAHIKLSPSSVEKKGSFIHDLPNNNKVGYSRGRRHMSRELYAGSRFAGASWAVDARIHAL
ncbi:hypothetical protein P692DRAFT_20882973 [Suillus brevipes Sb2]|nr:hypothetical protein P692DRAFT_20882973 [Suillus brevipes Sb2]